MAHSVQWDAQANRPIVGGKYEDPETGELVERGPTITYGPPTLDLLWVNIHGGSNFVMIRGPHPLPLDKVLIQVSNGIKNEVYTVQSITATKYSVTVVMSTPLNKEEFKMELNKHVLVAV